MRRRKLSQLYFDNYHLETETVKEQCQEMVFEYYYDRNDCDLELAIEEIREDIVRLVEHERYERCALLKDILNRFE
tara:strand:- start:2146 stop:2373 length:228 start_codon:yes stop_codon:yes gene_type:complete